MDNPSTSNILIVDDNPSNLRLLSQILKREGYSVRSLRKGQMVLPSVVNSPPDIILLDIMMPEMDGYEVCRQLKTDRRIKNIPVLFISALNDSLDKVKAFKTGGVDYITKPINEEETLARIKAHLELHTLRKELEVNNRMLQQEVALRKEIEEALLMNEERLEALLRLSQMKAKTEQEIIAFALEEGVRLSQSTVGYFHFFNQDQKTINLNAWSRDALKECTAEEVFHYPLGEAGVWADSIRERKPVIHNDYSSLSTKNELPEGHITIFRHMSVPVFEDERVVAVCGVGNKISPYDDTDIRQLSLFMSRLWEIIIYKRAEASLAEANRKLERLASMDGLTQIANRRRFDEYFQQEWRRLMRTQEPLSLILGDIDFFKLYNDTYGHPAGDDILKKVAKVMERAARRPADFAARYGGEEFVLVLPNTNVNGAVDIAGHILEGVRNLKTPHLKSTVSDFVTMSLGVASTIPSQRDSAQKFIQSADKALYEAKEQGRNRVIFQSHG